jgi:hypothetical protein
MTVQSEINRTLAIVALAVIGILLMLLAWAAPGARPNDYLLLAGSVGLGLSFIAGCSVAVDAMAQLPPQEPCGACDRMREPTDLVPTGAGVICVDCLDDVPQEAA